MKRDSRKAFSTRSLEEVRSRFEVWRKGKDPGSRIPDELWEAAAELSRRLGISPVARALRLDYYGLKKRAERAVAAKMGSKPEPAPVFVELAVEPPIREPGCRVEMENAQGARMRIHLPSESGMDLEALSRAFWRQGL